MSAQKAPTEAIAFLLALRPSGPWTVAAIHPVRQGVPKSLTSSDIKEVHQWIEGYRDGWNLYFQDNPAKLMSRADRTKKLAKDDIAAAEFAKADIDRDANGVRLINVEGGKEEMVRRLKAGEIEPGPPTFIIDSGNGLQALWRFADPFNLDVADAEEKARNLRGAEGISRTISASLGADSCWTINHLFRLPGTMNYPDARKRSEGLVPVPTRIVYADKARTYHSFDCPFDQQLANAIPVGSLEIDPPIFTDIDELVHKYQLPQSLVRRITDEPEGDRSGADWNVCLALLEAGVPPEEVHGVLLNPEFGISARTLDESKNGGDPVGFSRKTVVNAAMRDRARRLSEFQSWVETVPDVTGEAVDNLGRTFRKWHRFKPTELLKVPDPTWLVRNILIAKGLGCVFGGPKVGKTFHVLHLALCVATGKPFFGLPVQQGRVLYVISEGNDGEFRDRIRAWCIQHEYPYEDLDGRFEVVRDPVMLDDPDSVDGFLKVDHGPYDLTIFDTFANSMQGDENKTQDMNKAVGGANKVRIAVKGAVLFVHHSQKDGRVERGSSVLRGAVDSMMGVHLRDEKVRNETVMFTAFNRSAPDIDPIHCRRVEVFFDDNTEANPDDRPHSMALIRITPPATDGPDDGRKGQGDRMRRDDGKFDKAVTPEGLLVEIVTNGVENWGDLVDEDVDGRSARSVNRHISKLVAEGYVTRPQGPRKRDIALTEKGEVYGNELSFVDPDEMPDNKED